ncbi:Icc-related predicted phosphoesterase [Rhizobium leguminosarum]|uniref:Icc-related predicted phosphoesterase n=1 Tax=Rhizobium leguminosarum TaxID=384 RepID=A0AAE2MHE5_RHILE|nr:MULTISPECIES: metallophosphoesterase [Rhizobium]MBB4289503.1 Icc-related predicted phosphoesterase [Rhizobium leguminosarum]MBB4294401.1 Icc-related predicted phosphoesterase [Rhizobium leguminosarum]MBB4305797.1 Icc-related predicted phosphoesterase [Rhizobium leguminosarum]MBB4418626.1 Icc-related predicted phosphoesterase [Rhizobium leguminosarum]MBB4433470.1 Icc-related predicted phosphoesterase [Rhizobium esperanzae]
MKIWIISDLHLEFGEPFDLKPPACADVVVCAGDVLTKGIVPSLRWLTKHLAGKVPVVFVAGNHEFYGEAVQESLKQAVSESCSGVHFLENAVAEIDGLSFMGGTLWSDFRLFGHNPQVAMSYAAHGMNDYRKIKLSKTPYSKFRPLDAYKKHVETRDFIASELRRRAGRRAVVITHHAPSPRSVAAGFRHDPLSANYASDLEDLILDTRPTLWVHGHVHHRNDYYVGNTRIVSNPRGYPREHTHFEPGLIVEV